MGPCRAAVALAILGGPFFSGGLASQQGRSFKQLACIDNEKGLATTVPRRFGSSGGLELARIAKECCDAFSYFAVGGATDGGHHNQFTCVAEIKQLLGAGHRHRVSDDKCDVGCPSRNKDYNTANGLCGGGCGGCDSHPHGKKCYGKGSATCGMYRSVYSCDPRETTLPEPEPVRVPVACRKEATTDIKLLAAAGTQMEEKYGRKRCCEDGWKYYVMGGHAKYKEVDIHHGFVRCFPDKLSVMSEMESADYGMCDVGCPGGDMSFDKAEWGVCGGGCKGCKGPATCPAQRSRDAQCALYWAVYSCDASEQPWSADESFAPATPGAAGQQRREEKARQMSGSGSSRFRGEQQTVGEMLLPDEMEALKKGLTGASLAISSAVEDAMQPEEASM